MIQQEQHNQSELEEQEFKSQSNEMQAFFNFIKAMVGIGIIALPYVSFKVGWLWALILLLPVLFCVTRSNFFLIEVADDLHAIGLLYSDCARVIYGGIFPYIVDTTLILHQMGACIAYLLFFTQFIKTEFLNYGFELHKIYFFIIALIFVLPLSLIKNMHFFHRSSTTGFLLGLIGLIGIIIEAFLQCLDGETIKYDKPIDITKTFSYFGIAIISFEGIQALLPIRDSMIDRFNFKKVFYLVIFVAFFLAVTVQQSTVLIFGENTEQLVIFNFKNDKIRTFVTLCYLISLLLTYPLQLFVGVQILERELIHQPYSQLNESEIMNLQIHHTDHQVFVDDWISLSVRMAITGIIFGIAYLVPDISAFFNLLGANLGSCIQYVFPVLLHMKRFWNSRQDRPYFSYIFILLISLLSMVLGTYESINDMREAQFKQ